MSKSVETVASTSSLLASSHLLELVLLLERPEGLIPVVSRASKGI